MPERRILIARILGAFGVSGEMKCQSFADPPAQVLKYNPLILIHNGVEQSVERLQGRMTAKGPVVRLPGIEDRDAAQAMLGAELWVLRSQLPKPKLGEYYWADLEGMRVVNREGIDFGTVSHLFETPGNAVMVVTGERERLIPFLLDHFVDSVDIEAGEIRVDWDADF
jgi:16S rRNA processing protein RimM